MKSSTRRLSLVMSLAAISVLVTGSPALAQGGADVSEPGADVTAASVADRVIYKLDEYKFDQSAKARPAFVEGTTVARPSQSLRMSCLVTVRSWRFSTPTRLLFVSPLRLAALFQARPECHT